MKNQNQKKLTNNNKNHQAKKPKRINDESNRDSSLIWICGKHASFAALLNKNRKIYEILTTKNSSEELNQFLQKNSLQHFSKITKITNKEDIEKNTYDQVHQGIAVKCSKLQLKTQFDLLENLHQLEENSKLPTLVLLDQISDPHNVGAIIRSAAAFGVNHIIFCEHNSAKESAAMVKSAAGNIEFTKLFCVTNFNNLIEKLKKIGYWCVGLAGEGNVNLSKIADEYKNIALIIGSEGNGLRDLVKKNCDLLARIEINSKVESLNASVAAAIALYEITKNPS